MTDDWMIHRPSPAPSAVSERAPVSNEGIHIVKDNSTPPRPAVGVLPPAQPVSVPAPSGLVSFLIACCGQLAYTKLCVPSVLRYARKPFELIFPVE
jgi:hypothetical protein